MEIYVLILFSVGAIYLASKINYGRYLTKKTIFLFLSMSLLFFFMAMRGKSVGADTKQYYSAFIQIYNLKFSEVFTASIYGADSRSWLLPLEMGYRLYNKLLTFWGSSGQIITIANSVLIIVMNYVLIKRHSQNLMLSVWLYITLGFFQTQMNTTRNAIAILIVYLSFDYIKKRKAIPFSVCILTATMFHTSSLIFFALYWLINGINLTKTRTKIIWGVVLLFSTFFSYLRPYLIGFVPGRYRGYFMAGSANFEVLAVGLLHLGLFIFIYMFTQRNKHDFIIKSDPIGVWMLILDICSYILAFTFSFATRLAGLFGPYLVFFIPSLIENGIGSKRKKKRITFLIVLLCGIQYIIRLSFNNIGHTMPYQFFWE